MTLQQARQYLESGEPGSEPKFELAAEFVSRLSGCTGSLARANDTFFAHQLVTLSLGRLRLALMNGETLTEDGLLFVAQSAGYLARLAYRNMVRRGLSVGFHFQYGGSEAGSCVRVGGYRQRGEKLDEYAQDFLEDTLTLLIRPPQDFPTLHERALRLESLALASPEYLYMYGVFLAASPLSWGDWPRGESVGGTEEDFTRSKELLIDDLLDDCGLSKEDPEFRQLSLWTVFPPYGWEHNEGQDYNLMTLIDLLCVKKAVPLERGVEFLRGLLRCQLPLIRNLGARALMVLGIEPATIEESLAYAASRGWADWDVAVGPMLKYRSLRDGTTPPAGSESNWAEAILKEWEDILNQAPVEPWRRAPILSDREYVRLGSLGTDRASEARAGLEALSQKNPGNWFLDTALAGILIHHGSPLDQELGETMLRMAIQTAPDCSMAHITLSSWLAKQNRKAEATVLLKEAIKQWPWDERAVDACLGLVTSGLTSRA